MNKEELWKKYWDNERSKKQSRIFDPENLFNFHLSEYSITIKDMMWWAYTQSEPKAKEDEE